MQVIAFQDPATGRFFGSQELLSQHLAEQAILDQAKAVVAAATQRLQEMGPQIAQNLVTPADMVSLTTEFYEELLPLLHTIAPLRRGRKPKQLKLVSVSANDPRITPGNQADPAKFSVHLQVLLSSEPLYGCNPLGDGITPYEVMKGFSSHCGGCSTNDDGTYVMSYYMQAPLSLLPKMSERIAELKTLHQAKEQHENAVTTAQTVALSWDAEVQRLQALLERAREAAATAAAHRNQVAIELEAREREVSAKEAVKLPFVEDVRWKASFAGFEQALELYASEDAPTALLYL